MSRQRPQKHRPHSRYCRKQSLVVPVLVAAELAADYQPVDITSQAPFRAVHARIITGHRHKGRNGPVAQQNHSGNDCLHPPVGIQHYNCGKKVTQADSLQHARPAHLTDVEPQKAVENKPKQDKYSRPFQYMQPDSFSGDTALDTSCDCKRQYQADDEKKKRKYQVLEAEAFPGDVGKLAVDCLR